MADTFDPYHRWLSIPPEEQPPNHYRLLGLKVLEDDADVIDSAADRQMTHVRTFQSGKFAEHSQRILNEISTAKVTLLDPTKKATYDAQLRAKLGEGDKRRRAERPLPVAQPLAPTAVAAALPPAALPPAAQPPTVAPPTAETAAEPLARAMPSTTARARRKEEVSPAAMLAIGGVVLVTLTVLGAVAVIVRPWESPTTVAQNDPPPVTPPNDQEESPPTVEPPIVPPKTKPPKTKPPEDSPDDEIDEEAPLDGDEPEGVIDFAPPDDEPELDPGEEPEAVPARAPVPAKAERDAKRANIDAIFHTAKAKTPAEKADLAAQLMRTAVETPDDAVAVFVMLNLARELAADTARMNIAFDCIDLLERQFDFDADAVRILSIAQGAKAAVPNDAKQEVIAQGVALADQLAVADRYGDATKVLTGLVELARRAREPQLASALIERRRVNESLFDAFKAAQAAVQTLKTSPVDAAANLAVGRFYLFVKNDAARGLTHLAKGGSDPLAAAAKLELEPPKSPDEQEQLADAWWNLAANEEDKNLQKKLQSRAMAWYERVQPELKGLAAAKADKRLQELTAAGIEPAEIDLDLGDAAPPVSESAPTRVDLEDGLVAHWKFDEGNGAAATDAVAGLKGEIRGATWVSGARGKALRFDGKDDSVLLGNPGALNFDGPMTIAAWVRTLAIPPQTTQGDGFIVNVISHGYAYDARREVRLSLEHAQTGPRWVGIAWHGDTSTAAVGKFDPQELGQWAHVAMTCDGAAWRFYRNGRLIGEKETTQLAVTVPADWAIAAHSGGSPRNFNGDIDELRIYRRGLAENDVRALYLGKSATIGNSPSPVAGVPARPINLLTKINPKTDSIVGPWEIQKGALRAPIAPHARVRVPVDPGEEYDLQLVVEPTRTERTLVVGLVGPGKQKFAASFQSWDGGKFTGLEFLDGKPTFQNETAYDKPVFNDGRNTIVCSVRKTGVRVTVNDEKIVDWQGDFARLGIDRNWDIADNAGLFVGAYNSGFWVHTLTLTPFEPSARSPASTRGDVTRGLVAHWKFDEGVGAMARDSVGANHGEIRGAKWTKGARGGALHFDGESDLVFIGNPEALRLERSISIAAWVKVQGLPPEKTVGNIVAQQYTDRSEAYLRLVRTEQEVLIQSGGVSDGVNFAAAAFLENDVDQWIHVVGVFDGSTWYVYRQGRLLAKSSHPKNQLITDGDWAIGAKADGGSKFFHGDIDDVRIYNRGLSADEVRSLYLGLYLGRSPTTADVPRMAPEHEPVSDGLVAHWKFDDAQGTVAKDSAGNNDGKIEGDPKWTKGVRGGALSFNGSDNRVLIANDPSLNFTGEISLACWIKPHTLPPRIKEHGIADIVTHGFTMKPNRDVLVRILTLNSGEPTMYDAGSWDDISAYRAQLPVPPDHVKRWVHVASVYDGKNWTLYHDGKAVASRGHGTGAVQVDSPWAIGGHSGKEKRFFHGEIDDVRIYNRGLSPDEVKTLFVANGPTTNTPRVQSQPAPSGVDKDLVAHWNFDEGRGTAARDAASGEAASVDGATWTDGKIGKALHFDGKTSTVAIADRDDLNAGGPMTLAAWIRPERIPQGISFMNVLAHASAAGKHETYLRLCNGQYAVGDYAGTHDPTEKRVPQGDAGTWIHLAGVYDGESWHIYRNGERFHSRRTTHGPRAFAGPWAIGSSPNNKDRFFEGDIDDVRIYGRALTDDELQALAAADDDHATALPRPQPPVRNALPAAPLPSRVVITRAVYGAGGQVVDVTDKVRAALAADPFAPVQADDRAFGDPASGTQKEFAVTYAVAGKAQTVRLNQQTPVQLPQLPVEGMATKDAAEDFRIIAARYGAGLTWIDITEAVRRTVSRTDVAYQWSFQDSDPWFGVAKRSSVWFDYKGKRYHRFFTDGETQALLH